jgi:hypothetical protein
MSPTEPLSKKQSDTLGLKPYYGFDPKTEYVLRCRNHTWSDRHQRFLFHNGEALAPRMRPDATEAQIWNRGERLSRIAGDPAYQVYVRGKEPARDEEPLWAHVDFVDLMEDFGGDSGEEMAQDWRPEDYPVEDDPRAAGERTGLPGESHPEDTGERMPLPPQPDGS